MDLTQAREVINKADEEIVRAFMERMNAVVSVARYKKENNMPILDRSREHVVLDRVEAMAGEEMGGAVRQLYEHMMAVSRDYQMRLLELGGDWPKIVKEGLDREEMTGKIACMNDLQALVEGDTCLTRDEEMLFDLLDSGVCEAACIADEGLNTARKLAPKGVFAYAQVEKDGKKAFLVSKTVHVDKDANRFGLYLTLVDEPGALALILDKLAAGKINGARIDSDNTGEVYIEGNGCAADERTRAAVGAAVDAALSGRVAGWWKE